MKKWYTIEETAMYLELHDGTVRNWCKNSKLKSKLVSRPHAPPRRMICGISLKERFDELEERRNNLPGEVWRDTVEFPDHFEVSNLGRVKRKVYDEKSSRRSIKNLTLKPSLLKQKGMVDRAFVGLSVNGQGHGRSLAQLVARSFLGPPPEGIANVKHKDGDVVNCAASNLYYEVVLHGRLMIDETGAYYCVPQDHLDKLPDVDGARVVSIESFIKQVNAIGESYAE